MIYTIFAIIPVIYVVYLAFTNYTGMGKADFVGFENFIRIFNDERFTPAFFNALKNNLKYLLCVWFIITPFQYFLAYFFFHQNSGLQIHKVYGIFTLCHQQYDHRLFCNPSVSIRISAF